uniref:Uncharacterized protein n=1 Tax=Alexandrium andersonii TaxID=327968 RepID=A0A7S2CWH9_9DINO|mmetsp:Transcript_43411/g.98528  ORF Transcript_43411/g.98528 Transcript_43411/m.98528 type:complete len:264 (+) Transcript_43411:91-882(+)
MLRRLPSFLVAALLPLAECVVDDAAALIQVSGRDDPAPWPKALARSLAGAAVDDTAGNILICTSYPELCVQPFDCGNLTMREINDLKRHAMAPDGHANLQMWCAVPMFAKYINTCIVRKDLVAAAHVQFKWAMDHKDEGADELDASYCFIEGHCKDTTVTSETTLEEADRLCDTRFGSGGWGRESLEAIKKNEVKNFIRHPGSVSAKNGFQDRGMTTPLVKTACAMGNYHCDLIYCRETYCKTDYYIQKYSHLAPKKSSLFKL